MSAGLTVHRSFSMSSQDFFSVHFLSIILFSTLSIQVNGTMHYKNGHHPHHQQVSDNHRQIVKCMYICLSNYYCSHMHFNHWLLGQHVFGVIETVVCITIFHGYDSMSMTHLDSESYRTVQMKETSKWHTAVHSYNHNSTSKLHLTLAKCNDYTIL